MGLVEWVKCDAIWFITNRSGNNTFATSIMTNNDNEYTCDYCKESIDFSQVHSLVGDDKECNPFMTLICMCIHCAEEMKVDGKETLDDFTQHFR